MIQTLIGDAAKQPSSQAAKQRHRSIRNAYLDALHSGPRIHTRMLQCSQPCRPSA